MPKVTRIILNDSLHFHTVYFFSMVYIISTTIDYASVMLSIYAKLSSHLLAVQGSEWL